MNNEKPTLAEKQKFWKEQQPLFEEQYWLTSHFEYVKFDIEQGNYVVREDIDLAFQDDADDVYHRVNTGWSMWKRAVNHMSKKLDGCVVVPKDQIEVLWQDSEEPENFATTEDGLSFIAQHIQDDELMEINEHHTVHLPSVTKFGAWVYQNGQRKFFVGTKDEVEAARGGNHD